MTVFDDLEAEEERIEGILAGLDDDAWRAESAASGWSVADVVVHLAQSEEMLVAGTEAAVGFLPAAGASARKLDEVMDAMVRADRDAPDQAFERWRQARRTALVILREADPRSRIPWATNPLPPTTLATTRIAEHWAHGLDITEPLGIPFPDTARLGHVAWLAHRTLPYAFTVGGTRPSEVRCELTGPDGERWELGPPGATSRISGPVGDFCRVGARRLSPDASQLRATGPHGADALRVLRNYAA